MMINSQKFNRRINQKDLSQYLTRQLNNFFPDQHEIDAKETLHLIQLSEERVFSCFSGIKKKYFNEDGITQFNHLMSDQYCMYLYMLANQAHKENLNENLATKIYYLNKSLHGVDIYFTTNLPEVFLLVHPVGTIIGRAEFSDFFIAYQGCTVGCLNDGIFPTFKGKTILYSNAQVLGNCQIGDNVCVAANTTLINEFVTENSVVIGNNQNRKVIKNTKPFLKRPPFHYE